MYYSFQCPTYLLLPWWSLFLSILVFLMLSSRKWFLNFFFQIVHSSNTESQLTLLNGFFFSSLSFAELTLPLPSAPAHFSTPSLPVVFHRYLHLSCSLSSFLPPLLFLSIICRVFLYEIRKKKLQLISHLLNLNDIFLVLAESPVVWLLHCALVVSFGCQLD